jgi:tripartite-type tricarboxylate transporter receptor subunit TctC
LLNKFWVFDKGQTMLPTLHRLLPQKMPFKLLHFKLFFSTTSLLSGLCLLGICSFGLLTKSALAQSDWPTKPIRIVLPFPPGGPSDMVARAVAEKLQVSLKQNIVIENKPGAGGNIGAAEVSRANGDGYTWLFGTDTLVTVNPHVYKSLGYKIDDLKPVMLATNFSQTLVCHPSVGVKTLAELIAKAKTTPLSYASGGAGVPGHLSMELLLFTAGIDMTHVPYKGPAPAMQDVMGAQVPCGLLAGPTVLPQVRAGRLVALGVSGKERSPTLPEVPTMAEAGVQKYEANFALVFWAPKSTPDVLVAKFNQALTAALKSPDLTERLLKTDQTVAATSPNEANARLIADSVKWGEVARRIKLGLD